LGACCCRREHDDQLAALDPAGAAICVALVVMAFTFVGDGLRDALDRGCGDDVGRRGAVDGGCGLVEVQAKAGDAGHVAGKPMER